MKLDFTGVNSEFTPIPTGDYPAVFTGFKLTKSKSSGADMVVMEYTIKDPEFSGRKQWSNRTLLPQSLFMLKKDMLVLGADEETLGGEFELEEELDNLKGEECTLSISVGEYEGRPNNSIDRIAAA